jgi:hypothetical protein
MNTPQTRDHTSHGEGGLKIIGAGGWRAPEPSRSKLRSKMWDLALATI